MSKKYRPGDILVCEEPGLYSVYLCLPENKVWCIRNNNGNSLAIEPNSLIYSYKVIGNILDCPEIWKKFL